MQIISNIALISINETLLVQVISFLIFLYIINRIMFRPLRNIKADRENHIKIIQQDIVTAENELKALADQIEAQESAAKLEAFAQKEKLEAAAGKQAEDIFGVTHKEITEAKDKAQKEVEAQILEAKIFVKKEADVVALAIMEKILNRRMKP
ncbi:MAG: hypothetical protein HKO68_04125 [Desulfobacterales bacterium]|nr:hypothetical protein [Desulfobacterales bacterium]